MEFCHGQELYAHVKGEQAKGYRRLQGVQQMPKTSFISEKDVAEYVRQLAVGIEYMQERGIMHRDLKLSNILLTDEKIVKIIDFGLAV